MANKTNTIRANRGLNMLEYHQMDLLSEDGPADASYTGVASLLADILHYCEQNGQSFDDALALANRHYQDEINGCDNWADDEWAEK